MKLLLENWREYIKEEEDVNEIFDLGKHTADIDAEVLRTVFRTKRTANGLESSVREAHASKKAPHPMHIKSLLEKALRLYEERIDPLLSQMMVVKNQIEKGTHRWPSDLPRSLDKGPEDSIERALKALLRARGQMLGLYRKNRGYAGLPAYKPAASMHDLEKLMGTAKERE